MAKSPEALKIMEQRKQLLRVLKMFFPSPALLNTVYRTCCIDPTYDRSAFQKDIMYFRSKGWVEFVEERINFHPEFFKRTILLTGEGVEIAEGTDTDGALEI